MRKENVSFENLTKVIYDKAMNEYTLIFEIDDNGTFKSIRVDAADHEAAGEDEFYFDNEEIVNKILEENDFEEEEIEEVYKVQGEEKMINNLNEKLKKVEKACFEHEACNYKGFYIKPEFITLRDGYNHIIAISSGWDHVGDEILVNFYFYDEIEKNWISEWIDIRNDIDSDIFKEVILDEDEVTSINWKKTILKNKITGSYLRDPEWKPEEEEEDEE